MCFLKKYRAAVFVLPLPKDVSWRSVNRIAHNPGLIRTGNIRNISSDWCCDTNLLDHILEGEAEESDLVRFSCKLGTVMNWNASETKIV